MAAVLLALTACSTSASSDSASVTPHGYSRKIVSTATSERAMVAPSSQAEPTDTSRTDHAPIAAALAVDPEPTPLMDRDEDTAPDPEALSNLKPFPPAEPGMKRFVLFVPPVSHPSHFKVELQIGKIMALDRINAYAFASALESRTLKGWGFTYYVLPELGAMMSTRVMVDPEEPTIDRFVQIEGVPLMRYNSRLPIVIYAPEGVEVRFRLWQSAPDTKPVPQV